MLAAIFSRGESVIFVILFARWMVILLFRFKKFTILAKYSGTVLSQCALAQPLDGWFAVE